MRVKVKWRDIFRGQPRNSGGCPVALALRRVSRAEVVSVSMGALVVGGMVHQPPRDVLRFVIDFDRCASWRDRLKLRPFVFDLSGV